MAPARRAALLLALCCVPWRAAGAPERSCAVDGHVVVVDARERTLSLCSGRRRVARFPVALGRGGLGKQRRGDRRTPLGTYALGEPRPSRGYGIFIPIAYPTAEQRARGFTGTAVGIHGPNRRASWLGRLSTWVDWTAGCIATGTDADVARVAAFVRERRACVLIR